MGSRDDVHALVDLLSEYECSHIAELLEDAVDGSRYWEDDIGVLYHEYVKARYFDLDKDLSKIIPRPPVDGETPFAPIELVKSYASADTVRLRSDIESGMTLSKALSHRRSRRVFGRRPVSQAELGTLLRQACGVTDVVAWYGYDRLPLRSFATAGGLGSPELYVVVNDVAAMSPGIYHYRVSDDVLENLSLQDHREELGNAALGQSYARAAGVVLVIAGNYARLRWKYSERAYRFMCMDAGCLAQNLYLVAESLGLGACAVAGFFDDAVERLIGIDGRDEMALLLIAIGTREET